MTGTKSVAVAQPFSQRLVQWQRQHGRHDLPWQSSRAPYGVWLSEIMLQQTQVATVRQYFSRFMERFPSVFALAGASLDEVLALWSGLGYYSRARNLHRCAQVIVDNFGGEFPVTSAQLATLPGIGPSTAAAIAAFCFGERVSIMDANVQRVLGRYLAFDMDLAQQKNVGKLWLLATNLLPPIEDKQGIAAYTQGLMDLGAGICAARNPSCSVCPVNGDCAGYAVGTPTQFPLKTRKLKRSHQSFWMLWLQRSDGAVWFEQRPTPGVWAGLYAFPLFHSESEALGILSPSQIKLTTFGPAFKHVLTHKDMFLHPLELRVQIHQTSQICQDRMGRWVMPSQWLDLGMPAPIRRLLDMQKTCSS